MPEASRVDSGTGFQTTLPIATCGQRGTAESAVDGGGGVSRRAGSARRPPRSARPVREQRGGAERRQVAGTPFCRPRAGTVGFYPGGASAGGGVQEGGKAPVRSANRGAGRHSGQRGRRGRCPAPRATTQPPACQLRGRAVRKEPCPQSPVTGARRGLQLRLRAVQRCVRLSLMREERPGFLDGSDRLRPRAQSLFCCTCVRAVCLFLKQVGGGHWP